jgi:hypothetical protein
MRHSQRASRVRSCVLYLPWIAALAVCNCGAVPAWACSVPVFRYALERWPADAYQVYVFHRGPLSAADTARLATFDDAAARQDESRGANTVVHRCDLDDPKFADAADKLQELHPGANLPLVVVRSPWGVVVWSGSLESPELGAVVDSPARRELAARLLAGQTAVWLLLESGDRARDEAAAQTLESQLRLLSSELKLPDPAALLPGTRASGADRPTPGAARESGVPTIDPSKLRIEFSILRVARDDRREAALIRMLLASEEGLDEIQDPMAFPIFGRGRVLYALAGRGINADNIREACEFLVGPCSCQVKEMNPGVDLLMNVAWSRLVEPIIDVELALPPQAGWEKLIAPATAGQTVGPAEEATSTAQPLSPSGSTRDAAAGTPVPAGASSRMPQRESPTSLLRRNVMLVLLTLAAAVVIGSFVVMRRHSRRTQAVASRDR